MDKKPITETNNIYQVRDIVALKLNGVQMIVHAVHPLDNGNGEKKYKYQCDWTDKNGRHHSNIFLESSIKKVDKSDIIRPIAYVWPPVSKNDLPVGNLEMCVLDNYSMIKMSNPEFDLTFNEYHLQWAERQSYKYLVDAARWIALRIGENWKKEIKKIGEKLGWAKGFVSNFETDVSNKIRDWGGSP